MLYYLHRSSLEESIRLSCGILTSMCLTHGMLYSTFWFFLIHNYIYILLNLRPKYMDLCTPALVYLALSSLSFIAMARGMSASTLFINIVFILVWTILLNVLCQRGYTSLSWILVLLPIILLAITVVFIGQVALAAALSKNSVSPSSISITPSTSTSPTST